MRIYKLKTVINIHLMSTTVHKTLIHFFYFNKYIPNNINFFFEPRTVRALYTVVVIPLDPHRNYDKSFK